MTVGEIVKILTYLGLGSGWILFILFLIFIFPFPEKVKRWSILFWLIIRFFWREAEKKIVAYDIESRVNEFSWSLSKEIMNFKPIGVSIQWISKEESRRQFFSDNKLIIRMRKHQNQNKNFVYASMVFVSKALLRKTKRYISLSQKESIDLFIAKKLFEKGKSTILDQFFDDYFFPRINSGKKLAELIEKYNLMDKAGLFFPVFIQELTFLGEKVFFQRKSSEIIKEVNQFINFLENYANREIGEKDVSNTFEGTYCRCGIMIIAKWFKIGDVSPFIKYIKSLIAKKMEDIYVIGPDYKFNADFMNQISEFAQNNLKLEKYCEKKYKAKIKIEGERKEFNNYLILLRSPETIRYYDSEYKKQFMD